MQYQNKEHNQFCANRKTTFQFVFFLLMKWIKNLSLLKKSLAILTILSVIIGSYSTFFISSSQGAVYTSIQTSWSGGQTANVANHADNRTGWSEYSAKDANTSAANSGTDLQLSFANLSTVQTTDTDFNTGVKTNISVGGSGTSGYLKLGADSDTGTGVDGSFDLSLNGSNGGCSGTGMTWTSGTSTCTINTDTKAIFNFTSVNIPSGKILTASGSTFLMIKATGSVTINGTVILNGIDGANGGVGGAGGSGLDSGTGAGTSLSGGGGGGGFGGRGGNGANGLGGSTYDTVDIGGSGGGTCTYTAIKGGGGGGSIVLRSSSVSIGSSGTILANGGNGQDYCCGSGVGGGGSGGRVTILAINEIINNGIIEAKGGDGGKYTYKNTYHGGGGGGGRLTLHDNDEVISGSGTYSVSGGVGLNNGAIGVYSTSYNSFSNSGTFTSSVIDLGEQSNLTTIDFNKTIPTDTALTIDIQAGNTATPDETWTAWQTNVSSGGDISSLGSKRYIQYKANLSTTDISVTPSLDDITINYTSGYPTSPQTLTSNVYNTTFNTSRLQKIEWTETLLTNTDIKFQIRTSPDNSTWTDFTGPDGTNSTYFTSNTGTESMPSVFISGDNDQYFQYKVFLSSTDGVNTPTLSDVTVTYSDAAQPTISGVTDGTIYFTSVNPTTTNGTATLNGQPYTSGTEIGANGTYTLIVDNGQGATTSATFTLIINKTVIDPTPQKITTDYNSGIITVIGSSTEATNATIKTNYTLSATNASFTMPKDTVITPTSGTIDITQLTTQNITSTINQENSNSKAAIKIGIPNKSVTFSQNVTVTMAVSSSYNGEILKIYSRLNDEEDWTYETTCTVSDGECTFTTDHATEYTGNYEVSNSPTPTDTNLDINATISIICDDTVTMGTITGTGQSNLTTNEADCNIKTINSNGYQLAWQASTAYMENENGDRINAYTPASPNTPEVWDVSASDSEWGARIKSTSTDPDIVSGGIWDNTDSYSGTFLNVGTSSFVVANRSTETDQTGSDETIIFGAEIGSNKFQPTGTYDADVIITATTL